MRTTEAAIRDTPAVARRLPLNKQKLNGPDRRQRAAGVVGEHGVNIMRANIRPVVESDDSGRYPPQPQIFMMVRM